MGTWVRQYRHCGWQAGRSSCWSARRTADKVTRGPGGSAPGPRFFFFLWLRVRRRPGRGEVLLHAQALEGQESIGQHHQRGMAVKPVPGTAFKMVQAQLLFHLLVALLDRESAGAKAARPEGNGSWRAGC